MMSNEHMILQISGLTRLEQLELEDNLDPNLITFEERTIDENSVGEPITATAIIIVSSLAIKGLTAWFLKKRMKKQFKKTVEVVKPDGSVIRTTVEVDLTSSEAENNIMKQLGPLFSLNDYRSLLNPLDSSTSNS